MKAEAVGKTDTGGDEKLTIKFVWPYLWYSNTDKIGKLKYMVKLESDI